MWLDPGLAQEPGAGILGGALARWCAIPASVPKLRWTLEDGIVGVQIAVALAPYQRQPPSHGFVAGGFRGAGLHSSESFASAAWRYGTLRHADWSDNNVALHSENCLAVSASLETHFEVLTAFSAPWDAARQK